MHDTYRNTALTLMMETMPALRRLLDAIAVHDKNLFTQAKRAATSVISNHAEADGRSGGNRRQLIETALGSLYELRKQLKIAAAWGYVSPRELAPVEARLDRVGAMTWRRLHRAR